MTSDITQDTEKTLTDAPETSTGGRIYRPLTDIVETDQGVCMMLEMPGVGPDRVEITLENRVLTVRGKIERNSPKTCSSPTPNMAKAISSAHSRCRKTSTPTGSKPRCATGF